MLTARHLKAWFAPLSRTPLHPQWLCNREQGQLRQWLATIAPGSTVIDVGCAHQWPRQHLPPDCRYVGLDYPKTAAWYASKPSIHGDAQRLPLATGCAAVVLLLDVLEHLPDPARALAEIHRVLEPGGQLILQVPFLYPIHDAPADYTRWSGHGLHSLAGRIGFAVRQEQHVGEPTETAALLTNLAWSAAALDGIRQRRPVALLALLLPIIIPLANVCGWLLARLAPRSGFMPYAYRAIWTRT